MWEREGDIKLYKEFFFIIIIIFAIFIGDYITQNFTKNTVNTLTYDLNNLKNQLTEKSYEEANKQLEKIQIGIDEVHHKLSYYLEHNEIEKVETDFTACKSLIKTGDYNLAIEELEKTIFVLNHITDKYSFNLDNIF